jgi:hypothetical protein
MPRPVWWPPELLDLGSGTAVRTSFRRRHGPVLRRGVTAVTGANVSVVRADARSVEAATGGDRTRGQRHCMARKRGGCDSCHTPLSVLRDLWPGGTVTAVT